MNAPAISVVVPAYNQANYLGQTIESVLNQTLIDFELIIIDDASPDNTAEVVQSYSDKRIKYILHKENRHLAASRNTGILAAQSDLIAFLDADDLFHPEKLAASVKFLKENKQIGATYNDRYEIDAAGNTIGVWKAPNSVTLGDFVMGFPFAPSDMVVRREWLEKVNNFDDSYVNFSEDLDIYCRLALEGCKFAKTPGYYNYRRRHQNRYVRNIQGRLDGAVKALETTFSNPNCTDEVKKLRATAFAKNHLIWSYWSLSQGEVDPGKTLFEQALEHDPSYLNNEARELINVLVHISVLDGDDHEKRLVPLFSLLPQKYTWLNQYRDHVIGKGYLERGVREFIWGSQSLATEYFTAAASKNIEIDETFIFQLIDKVLRYGAVFDSKKAWALADSLSLVLTNVFSADTDLIRKLKADIAFHQASNYFKEGQFSKVPSSVWRSISNKPQFIFNRGLISIFSRSLFHQIQHGRIKHTLT